MVFSKNSGNSSHYSVDYVSFSVLESNDILGKSHTSDSRVKSSGWTFYEAFGNNTFCVWELEAAYANIY